MSKLYNADGEPLCDCTAGAECGHHENEHRPLSYRLGGMLNLTCTRGDLAVSYVGDTTDVDLAAKFAEHLTELEPTDV